MADISRLQANDAVRAELERGCTGVQHRRTPSTRPRTAVTEGWRITTFCPRGAARLTAVRTSCVAVRGCPWWGTTTLGRGLPTHSQQSLHFHLSEWGAEGANYSALYQMLTSGVPMPYAPHSIRT
jgi:hypothetical protein